MSRICNNCGEELDDNALLCSACGAIGTAIIDRSDRPEICDNGNDLPIGITPLIQYSSDFVNDPENVTIYDNIQETTASETSDTETAKQRFNKKYIIYLFTFVIFAAIILILLFQKDHDKASGSYRTAIKDYLNAICSNSGEQLLDVTTPDELIDYYTDNIPNRVGDYDIMADNSFSSLTWMVGDDPAVTKQTVIEKREIDASELSDYARTYELDSKDTLEFTVTKGYYIDLLISVEGSELKQVSKSAEAVVLKIDDKWVVYSFFCKAIPALDT